MLAPSPSPYRVSHGTVSSGLIITGIVLINNI